MTVRDWGSCAMVDNGTSIRAVRSVADAERAHNALHDIEGEVPHLSADWSRGRKLSAAILAAKFSRKSCTLLGIPPSGDGTLLTKR